MYYSHWVATSRSQPNWWLPYYRGEAMCWMDGKRGIFVAKARARAIVYLVTHHRRNGFDRGHIMGRASCICNKMKILQCPVARLKRTPLTTLAQRTPWKLQSSFSNQLPDQLIRSVQTGIVIYLPVPYNLPRCFNICSLISYNERSVHVIMKSHGNLRYLSSNYSMHWLWAVD